MCLEPFVFLLSNGVGLEMMCFEEHGSCEISRFAYLSPLRFPWTIIDIGRVPCPEGEIQKFSGDRRPETLPEGVSPEGKVSGLRSPENFCIAPEGMERGR